MPTNNYVVLPSGLRYLVYGSEGKSRCESIQPILDRWADYCNKNWISENHAAMDAPEKKVKRFLDGCGLFILLDDMGGMVTDYQKMKMGKFEIPMSSCPSHYENLIGGQRETVDCGSEDARFQNMLDALAERFDAIEKTPAKRKVFSRNTKFNRSRRIKKELGLTKITFARVDTEGCFQYGSQRYRISPEVEAYQPKDVDGDLLYDMDQVIVAEDGKGGLYFFDMDWQRIFQKNIMISG